MSRLLILLAASSFLAGCAANDAAYPSLAHRAGEDIDPRVPVERPLNDAPANAGLVARLDVLLREARAGDSEFQPAIASAQRLASGAGPRESESWIVAQQALSAAVDARGRTARAVGDIDAIGAELIEANGGIAPNDLEAIEQAARTAMAIASRQIAAVDAVEARLAR